MSHPAAAGHPAWPSTVPDPESLRAVTMPLPPEPALDPFALAGTAAVLFADQHVALIGCGLAAVLPLPGGLAGPEDLAAASAWLAAVPHHHLGTPPQAGTPENVRAGTCAASEVGGVGDGDGGPPGTRVTAFGSLPFDRSAAACLLVPEVLIGQEPGGRRWATVVAATPDLADPGRVERLVQELAAAATQVRQAANPPAGRPASPAPQPAGQALPPPAPLPGGHSPSLVAGPPAEPPDGSPPTLTPRPRGEHYRATVATAVARITGGGLRKVVLARTVLAGLDRDPDVGVAAWRLHAQEPACTVFAFPADPPGPAAAGSAAAPTAGAAAAPIAAAARSGAADPGSAGPGAANPRSAGPTDGPGPSRTARFVGASPELLVERRGAAVTCHPLAGTVALPSPTDPDPARQTRSPGNVSADPAGPDTDPDPVRQLLASAKDREEHRLVVEAILDALAPRCDGLEAPDAPSLVRLHTVAHLGTLVRGALRAATATATGPGPGGSGPTPGGRLPTVLELLADLHPTPAVGGVPRPAALACIEELEPEARGLWAGPVGWVDAAGDGRWLVGIRSATVEGHTVRMTAGAGVVAASDPAAELAETTVKLAPVLEAFSPGASHLL